MARRGRPGGRFIKGRNTFLLAALAFVVVALTTPFELVGIPLAPIAAILIGGFAGWRIAIARHEGDARQGARAGWYVGLGALLGSVVGLAVIGLVMGNIPEIQQTVRNSEPHPEAQVPTEWIAPLATLGGVVGGLVFGIFWPALGSGHDDQAAPERHDAGDVRDPRRNYREEDTHGRGVIGSVQAVGPSSTRTLGP
ncbi:MAG: hypothetical protein M3281_05235 [Chloroflexota bacterium]|nr:hypothetical protein [Chloroflexota bacterium]